MLAAIEARPGSADEDWLIIVCTDHGGIGLRHGGGRNEPDVRNTFLIVSGEASERGKSQASTYQVDVAATALTHLGIELEAEWELDGRPVGLRTDSR